MSSDRYAVIRAVPGGLELHLRVTPNASRTEAGGIIQAGGGDHARLKIRLHAKAVDGAANEALIGFLADRLGAPKSSIRIVRGEKSRNKTVAISADPSDIAHLRQSIGELSGAS